MYKIVSHCRCCHSSNLIKYADFGLQPLANSYHNYENMSAYFPLAVNLCKNCYHSQLSVAVDPKLMFDNYLYVSGTTKTFKKHCDELANYCSEQANVKNGNVLDIAANDGTLLNSFAALGFKTYGVDPAKNLLEYSLANNHNIINDYFNESLINKFPKFEIITGTNVFAHVDDISAFLKTCKKMLEKEGILVLEFPYCKDMIKKNEFDTIYHEHLSYFTINSFVYLANTIGFSVTDIVMTDIHGGSIRFVLRDKNYKIKNCIELQLLLEKEEENGLHNINSYVEFFRRIEDNRVVFHQKFYSMKFKQGYKFVGYGASAKGNTMLNYFKCDLDYIVDDNSLKWHKHTPGQNIVILPPDALREDDSNLAIVILSWNFYDEIKQKITKLREDKKTVLIRYVPEYMEEFIN